MEKRSFYSGGGPVSPQFQRADPQALYPVPLNQPIRDYYQFQRNGFSPNPHYKEQVKVELQDYLGERIKKIEDRQTKMEREKKEKEVQEKKKELQEKERIRKQREKALEARNKQLAAENMRLKKLVPNQFKRL
jgi:hypothetical protein